MLANIECSSYTKQWTLKLISYLSENLSVSLPAVKMKGPGNFYEIFRHQYLHKYFHSNSTPAQIWEFSKWLHKRNEVNFINEVETQD